MKIFFLCSEYKPASTTPQPYLMITPVKIYQQESQHRSQFHQINVENKFQDETSTKESLNFVTPLQSKKVSKHRKQ